jgi:hypothetical protein
MSGLFDRLFTPACLVTIVGGDRSARDSAMGPCRKRRRAREQPNTMDASATPALASLSDMGSVHYEMVVEADAAHVWDVMRDVGAVHERLLPVA